MSYRLVRRWMRKKMLVVPEEEASKWKQRLSIAYMLIAWNAMGLTAWAWYNGKLDLADYYGLKTDSEKMVKNNEYFFKTIGQTSSARLITMKGFTIVEDRSLEQENPENSLDDPKETINTANSEESA